MLHVAESGWYRMWPNPLPTEAVIAPLPPEVRSVRSMRSPSVVSCMWIRTRSPGLMRRSFCRSGLTAAKFGLSNVPVNSGFAGACEWPSFVM